MNTPTPLSSSDTKTILVVDDDPSTMLICVKTLRAEGFTVLEAEGSSEALKILATHQEPIDLLLTDLMLAPPGFQLAADKNPYPRSVLTQINIVDGSSSTTRIVFVSDEERGVRVSIYNLQARQIPTA